MAGPLVVCRPVEWLYDSAVGTVLMILSCTSDVGGSLCRQMAVLPSGAGCGVFLLFLSVWQVTLPGVLERPGPGHLNQSCSPYHGLSQEVDERRQAAQELRKAREAAGQALQGGADRLAAALVRLLLSRVFLVNLGSTTNRAAWGPELTAISFPCNASL